MTEINIHKNGGSQKELAAPTRAWEPFQLMRSLLRWDPFAEMSPVPIGEAAFSPAFDVKETKDGFIFKADLPGIEEKDLDVKITKNRLSVDAPKEILVHAGKLRSRLVCLEASERTLTGRLVYGNPVEEVLRDAPCDIAVYRASR